MAVKSKFDSKFEERVGQALGSSFAHHGEKLTYTVPKTYEADFVSGNVIIEAKGFFRPGERSKMLHVKQQNPSYTYRLILQKPDNKISKSSKTTYRQWAIKNGFEVWTLVNGKLIDISVDENELKKEDNENK